VRLTRGCPTLSRFLRKGGQTDLDPRSSPITSESPTRIYNFPVTNRLHRYYGADYLHFITCSCFRRLPLLINHYDLFLKFLEETRQTYRFLVSGYVLMPEHFHLLIGEPEIGRPPPSCRFSSSAAPTKSSNAGASPDAAPPQPRPRSSLAAPLL